VLTSDQVKKIRLKGNDDKIFREINALSRLSHRFIVRYYTTWIERHKITSSTTVSDDSTSEDSDTNPDLSTGTERVGNSSELCLPVNGRGLSYDFGFGSTDGVRGGELSPSFPSIHFGRSKD
jgi:translation initiation factor 2-alpha kinase 4